MTGVVRLNSMGTNGEITQLLSAWSHGDHKALDDLMPVVYGELNRIARNQFRSQAPGHVLQPTALISEAFLKLVPLAERERPEGETAFQDRNHFFAIAAMAMRQVLVNHAEANLAGKRGSGQIHVPIHDVDPAMLQEARSVIALHDALGTLADVDPRKAKVVELRYFGGMSISETAAALGISEATVTRDWQLARAWLAAELGAKNEAASEA